MMSEKNPQVKRLAFLSAATPEAEAARARLVELYGDADPTRRTSSSRLAATG